MKVILLQDVAKIGRRFDVVEVPSGYGMNKLIPQGMAKPATQENLKAIQAQSAKAQEDRIHADESFAEILITLKDVTLEIPVEANEEGRLFQALKAETIVTAIKNTTSKEVTDAQVVMQTPIKEVGEHTIEIASGDTSSSVTIRVVSK